MTMNHSGTMCEVFDGKTDALDILTADDTDNSVVKGEKIVWGRRKKRERGGGE